MSLENARAAYPILVQLARELSLALREHRSMAWISYDDFCQRCKDVGVKETPRTIVSKLLKPLQAACLEHSLPDLTALIIQKPKPRADFGNLHRPSDGWWEPYIARGEKTEAGDIPFWFKQYQAARDYDGWPEEPFF
jgi:dihydroneopterin aldolase